MILLTVQIGLAQNQNEIVIGNQFIFNSQLLNEDRTCLISLPDSYDDSQQENREYPLIILLDGYVHFKTAAGIVHFMSSVRNRNHFMPESIIVAIENVDRERDFTVTKIKTKRPNTMGGGRKFLEFIETELIPYVDENYNTAPNRILIGHSLGGLLTLNAFLDEHSVFDAFIAIDPSIWWDDDMMKDKVERISTTSLEKKLYIATAARDSNSGQERNKKRHDSFVGLLNQKSGGDSNVKIDYFETENHRSVPLEGLYKGLKYVFEETD